MQHDDLIGPGEASRIIRRSVDTVRRHGSELGMVLVDGGRRRLYSRAAVTAFALRQEP